MDEAEPPRAAAKPDRPGAFLLAFGALFLAVWGVAVPFNMLVDPMGRFGSRIPALNGEHIEVSRFARLAKPGIVCRLEPVSVALGTSRVELGIDPSHPGWQAKHPGPVYNFALAGSGLREIDLTYRHAVNASPRLRQAVVGLDFLMFNAEREGTVFETEVRDFDAERLVVKPGDTCLGKMIREFNRFLGLRAIWSSVFTVAWQWSLSDRAEGFNALKWLALYDDDGFRRNFDIVDERAKKYGDRNLFGNGSQERYYASTVWRPPPTRRYCFRDAAGLDTIETFRGLVRYAMATERVDTVFVINPIHARLLLAVRESGLWPRYEAWKRALVRVLAEEAALAGRPAPPLWDFSGFNTVTREHVPPTGDLSHSVKWFWEAAHYRRQAGDLMLDRVFGTRRPGFEIPTDFGIRLAPDNIEGWTAATRAGLEDYGRQEPAEVAEIAATVKEVMATIAPSPCADEPEGGVPAR